MNKRGQIIEAGALIIIALTTLGIFFVVSASQNLYVGDSDSGHFLNYHKCKNLVKNISEENLVIFNSKQEALDKGYNETERCV